MQDDYYDAYQSQWTDGRHGGISPDNVVYRTAPVREPPPEQIPGERDLLQTQTALSQLQLSQAERTRLQTYQNAGSAVEQQVLEGTITPQQGQQLRGMIGQAAAPLRVRASQIPIYMARLRYQQLQSQAAHQQAIMQQDAAFRARGLPDRVVTVTHPVTGQPVALMERQPGQFDILPTGPTGQQQGLPPAMRDRILQRLATQLDNFVLPNEPDNSPLRTPQGRNRYLQQQYQEWTQLMGMGGQTGAGAGTGDGGGTTNPPPGGGGAGPSAADFHQEFLTRFGLPGGQSQPAPGGPAAQTQPVAAPNAQTQPAAQQPRDMTLGQAPRDEQPVFVLQEDPNATGFLGRRLSRDERTRPVLNPHAMPDAADPAFGSWLQRVFSSNDLQHIPTPTRAALTTARGLLQQHGDRARMPIAIRLRFDAALRRAGVPVPPENPNAWVAPPGPARTQANELPSDADLYSGGGF